MSVQLRPVSNTAQVGNVPLGDYRVRLLQIDYHEQQDGPYRKDEPDLKWVMAIKEVVDAEDDSEDGDPEAWVGKDLWLFTGQSMGVRKDGSPTKGREAAEAFAGRRFEEDELVEVADLLNQEAIATVGRSQTGRTKVTRMRRLPKRTQGKPSKSAPPPTDDDTEGDPWDE